MCSGSSHFGSFLHKFNAKQKLILGVKYVSTVATSLPLHSDTHLIICVCLMCVFSEALLALQSEVSRLKKDLEEGLVQLPHLAQKMDYLTSKYRQERQERRSKTRSKTHHRSGCNR